MAPAMSMRCMTVPPRMNPSGLASFGNTTCTISVADSEARLGVRVIFYFAAGPTPAACAFAASPLGIGCSGYPLSVAPSGAHARVRARSFSAQHGLFIQLRTDLFQHTVDRRVVSDDVPRHEAENRVPDPAVFRNRE